MDAFVEVATRIEKEIKLLVPAYSAQVVRAERGEGCLEVVDYLGGRLLFGGDEGQRGEGLLVNDGQSKTELLTSGISSTGGGVANISSEIIHIENLLLERIAYLRKVG